MILKVLQGVKDKEERKVLGSKREERKKTQSTAGFTHYIKKDSEIFSLPTIYTHKEVVAAKGKLLDK